ncbi:HAD-IIA family hydrolase [Scopulibacillus cellulosilyticus]|uniref:Acid sugar phosphatase n=1 Tax=Scopulibacillus cellulosilyticus TaxID=2665665 RepID=A0ABW2Q593_9BACL
MYYPKFAFIFDLDGTLYIEDELISGAKETLEWVRKTGSKVRFVTNNPRYSREYYARKLTHLGIPALESEVLTSANFTAIYLKQTINKNKAIFVIGEQELKKECYNTGLRLTERPDADIVIVSFDTTLSYDKIYTGHQALIKGARFFATNPDFVCPGPNGGLPDAGAIIAALQASTGKKLELVFGKPSNILAHYLTKELHLSPSRCIVVGDRLNTDILFGNKNNMFTVWINNSKTNRPVHKKLKPNRVIYSIGDLPGAISDLFM